MMMQFINIVFLPLQAGALPGHMTGLGHMTGQAIIGSVDTVHITWKETWNP